MYSNRIFTIAALVGGGICLLLSILNFNFLTIILSSAFFSLSLLIWKYGYLLIPVFTKASNIVEVRDSFEIPSTRDSILKKADGQYYATKFLEVRFYESSMDKNSEEKATLFDSFERMVGSLKYVVRITMMLNLLDLSNEIEKIKTRRGEIESKRSKEAKLSAEEGMRMDRELNYLNRLLDKFGSGDKPVEVISFASTTASGLTKEEAITKATRQAKELKTIISSSLACEVRELVDLEMINCFEWEKFQPSSNEEFQDRTF